MADRMQQLERALVDLGERLDYPEAPTLASRVRVRIERGPVARPRFSRKRLVALTVAATFALAGTAVAIRFALRGVEIRERPSPIPTSTLPAAPLNLGERVSLSEARGRVEFPVVVPGALGAPDEVWVGTEPSGGRVSLLYRSRPGLPPSHAEGAGALLTQFVARLDEDFVLKQAGTDTKVERLMIRGEPAFWLEGDPHMVVFIDREGETQPDDVRLAGNVLLWQRGETTLRLEAEIPRVEAIRIAESVS